MKRPTFNETVGILVKAYLNDELHHDDCTKCVVGNLCGGNDMWRYLFMTDPKKKNQILNQVSRFKIVFLKKTAEQIFKEAEELCLSTGYSVAELQRIEYAFETAPGFRDECEEDEEGNLINDEWMFNGLMAVVDTIAEIHNVDLSIKESAKLQFVK